MFDSCGFVKLCDFGSATTESYQPDDSWSALQRSQLEEEVSHFKFALRTFSHSKEQLMEIERFQEFLQPLESIHVFFYVHASFLSIRV
ncbi:unnamed protein product [Toxocara canis]|uniref:Protein kinase domain-containing protein n=1 Tax=Toxocara canis TaxID=6265 RepID=A0A3P7FL50_TOXCA|nr:unnamed protein product [Toxocara canis]